MGSSFKALLAAPCLLLLAACGKEKPAAPPEPPAVNLPVALVLAGPAEGGGLASGTVEADDRVQLAARLAGVLRAPDLHDGQIVRRGQVLATIDPRQVEAGLARARGALEAARADQKDAQRDVERDAALAQSGAIAADAYAKEVLRAQVAAAALSQAQAAVAAAEADRSYAAIVSPVDGFVVSRQLSDGGMAMPGTPIATVEGRGRMVFRFSVSQAQAAGFTPGASVPVLLDGREDRPVAGRVRSLTPAADPATRRFGVEVLLPNDPAVRSGMFGRVRLPSEAGPGAPSGTVLAPSAAIVDRGGLTGVFVVGKDQRVNFRWIRLGDQIGERTEVTSGLTAGERILARVDAGVRDGARLTGAVSR